MTVHFSFAVRFVFYLLEEVFCRMYHSSVSPSLVNFNVQSELNAKYSKWKEIVLALQII